MRRHLANGRSLSIGSEPCYRLRSGERRLQRRRGQLNQRHWARLSGRRQLSPGKYAQCVSQRELCSGPIHRAQLSVRRATRRQGSSADRTLPRPTSTFTRTPVLPKGSTSNSGLKSSISSTGQTCRMSIPTCWMEISAKRRQPVSPDIGNWEARSRSEPTSNRTNSRPTSLEAGRLFVWATRSMRSGLGEGTTFSRAAQTGRTK